MTSAQSQNPELRHLQPFLKWPGGKRWLAATILDLFPSLASIEGTYYEPFLGSGAMFFHLNPTRAVLNDLNGELIDTFRSIRDSPQDLMKLMRRFQALHSKDLYYQTRSSRPQKPITTAARFLYLNRTCWNGLYRVNLKGEFNVPIGTKENVLLPSDDFDLVAKRLQTASLCSKDFAKVIKNVGDGDVIFADPPYTANHNLNGFLKYNEHLFSWEDQTRLHSAVLAAVERGASVIVTNANHSSIRDLYSNKIFTFHRVKRFSRLSGSTKGRKSIDELVISAIHS